MCSLDYFFFFKQKTSYDRRISDWSSDVCSSDLFLLLLPMHVLDDDAVLIVIKVHRRAALSALPVLDGLAGDQGAVSRDRKSVVQGKSVSVRVALGGRRTMKKQNHCNVVISTI